MGHAKLKVPGGKFLQATVKVNHETNLITSIILTGDFFLHPESLLTDFEQALTKHSFDTLEIAKTIDNLLQTQNGILVGAKPQDFAEVIHTAGTEQEQHSE